MEAWQIVFAIVMVLLPVVLSVVFHPRRERFNSRGEPLGRSWPLTPTLPQAPDQDQ